MKIRIVIVPPEKVEENRSVEGEPNVPRLAIQPNPMDEEVSLRSLIGKCQPMATQMTSWNDLDRLRSTAWLCIKDGAGAMEWMWNGKDGIHDAGEFQYHDIDITFEEVGNEPADGMCRMCVNVVKGEALETALLPPGRDLPFFEGGQIAQGETKVGYKIFGRVPNEWEGDDPDHPQNRLHISITAESWFEEHTFDAPKVRADSNCTRAEQPGRESNSLFLRHLMDGDED